MDEATPQSSSSQSLLQSKLQLPSSCDPAGAANPPEQRVWVIFGATGHIGRSIVRAALAHDDLVTAVGQSYEDTPSSIIESITASPVSTPSHSQNLLPLLCDVRLRDTVNAAIQRSITHWGRIDIIVNATGYGVVGAAEDQDEYDIRNQFEVNFWGTLNIIQFSLPYFRERGAGGRYLIMSGTCGALGVPGLAPYCATKYAIEGLVESAVYEVDSFNIKFTLVELGLVRRDNDIGPTTTTSDNRVTNPNADPLPSLGHFVTKPPSTHYSSPNAPAGHANRVLCYVGENKPSSSTKCAEVIWQLGHCGSPPMRLCLGGFAVESWRERLRGIVEEHEEWKWLDSPQDKGEEHGRDEMDEGGAATAGAVKEEEEEEEEGEEVS